jgi:superfamily II DNA or RNA helicase
MPRHPRASIYAKSHLFEGVKDFAGLERKIAALPTSEERGAAFEVFVEAFLAVVRKADFAEIYPHSTAPLDTLRRLGLTTNDMGVDGVASSPRPMEVWSGYQAKFRSNRTALTWRELSTFLGQSDSDLIAHRVLVTNTDSLPDEALAARQRFYSIRGTDLDELEESDITRIASYVCDSAPPPPRITPLPHQGEALACIRAELAIASRTSAFMACGTGKTLVALWAAEQSNAMTVLVLVPSLALMKQVLGEWLRHCQWKDISYLAVCSDKTVEVGLDQIHVNQAEFGYPVDTEPSVVRRFLDAPSPGVKLVFTTYQSARVVGEAMRPGEGFDLAVFDEAHKTAGSEGRNNAFALEDDNLRISKRLFFTATPRHYNPSKRDKDGSMAKVFSMDNPVVYGRPAYTLQFRKAVEQGIIVPYKVIVSVITSAQITKEHLENATVVMEGEGVRARHVASQLALAAAVAKHPSRHIFTFHQHVRAAKAFVNAGPEGIRTHLPSFTAAHVAGTMSAAKRDGIIKEFRLGRYSLLSNARCLTEGVNVPGVDMVAFMSPRRSRVDIIQAAGRAMRRAGPEKTVGYILLPLFVEVAKGETAEMALEGSNYEEIWEVLHALSEQDSVLADKIKEARRQRGVKGFSEVSFADECEILSSGISLTELRGVIDTQIVERLGDNWDEQAGALESFKKEHGHCDVPARNPKCLELARWVDRQRQAHKTGKLTAEKVARLESLGFKWSVFDSKWDDMFAALVEFRRVRNHCDVPKGYPENPALSNWVGTQRTLHKKGILPSGKVARLVSIGFNLDPFASAWEKMFAEYIETQGKDSLGPDDHGCKMSPSLRSWMTRQRKDHRGGRLPQQLTARLNASGFKWDLVGSFTKKMLDALRTFCAAHGHADVPVKDQEHKQLGKWVANQRTAYSKNRLGAETIDSLTALGFKFHWDSRVRQWEEMFAALVAFKTANGHCDVPQSYAENKRLASWVGGQRTQYAEKRLCGDRVMRLTAIGFSFDRRGGQWEAMFKELVAFMAGAGHCSVPRDEVQYKRLAAWVGSQRLDYRDNKISQERRKRLEDIGFVWDTRSSAWDNMLSALGVFKSRYGHCNPTPQNETEFPGLGDWTRNQRIDRRAGRMAPDRIERLDTMEFDWDPHASRWEGMLAMLADFKRLHGHCEVTLKLGGSPQLLTWMVKQRSNFKGGALAPERHRRLAALGVRW